VIYCLNRYAFLALSLSFALTILPACRKVESPATEAPSAASSPVVPRNAAPVSTSPSPGTSPYPIKTGEVPEMMRRAMTKEEVDKAFQQLPPQIRDRLKGLSYEPSSVSPQIQGRPTPTPAKK